AQRLERSVGACAYKTARCCVGFVGETAPLIRGGAGLVLERYPQDQARATYRDRFFGRQDMALTLRRRPESMHSETIAPVDGKRASPADPGFERARRLKTGRPQPFRDLGG